MTGQTWWEGGATGEVWKRCDTPLSLGISFQEQCTLRDFMSSTSRQQMQVLRWLSQVEETFCGSSIINYGRWMHMDANGF